MGQEVDRIIDSARSQLVGAIDQNVQFVLADVLDEFFRRSTVWREAIRIRPREGTLIYEIESEEYNARILALRWLLNHDGIVTRAYMPIPGQLRFASPPDAAHQYFATVDLTVALKAQNQLIPDFPAWIAERYADTIVSGILARLMAQPGKPWSSMQMAVMHNGRFRSGADAAKIETDRGNLVGAQNWRFPRFAAQR